MFYPGVTSDLNGLCFDGMNLYILKKSLKKTHQGLPWWLSGKESTKRRCTFDPWVRKIPWSWK